jgi:hypothetical protein
MSVCLDQLLRDGTATDSMHSDAGPAPMVPDALTDEQCAAVDDTAGLEAIPSRSTS